MNLKILFFGDIVGKIGRAALKKVLPDLKKQYEPDLLITNVENLAHGKGITKKTIAELEELGINIFTSGNHIWKKGQAEEILSTEDSMVLRPANYPPTVVGPEYKIVEVGTKKILVINLIGRVFFPEDYDCPFRKFDEIKKELKAEWDGLAGVIIDFHAEATSEKVALGWYVDGQVSAVLGTHTHIGTADAKILPQGTGYITDVGMVGATDSVLGVDKANVIKRFLNSINYVFEIPEEGEVTVNAIYLEIDPKTKKTTKIERVDKKVKV